LTDAAVQAMCSAVCQAVRPPPHHWCVSNLVCCRFAALVKEVAP
jgi:hypothetical protein